MRYANADTGHTNMFETSFDYFGVLICNGVGGVDRVVQKAGMYHKGKVGRLVIIRAGHFGR